MGAFDSKISKRPFFLLAIALTVKLGFFIIGVMDNRVFSFTGTPPQIFALGELESFRDYGGAYLTTIDAFKSGYTPYVDFWYAYPPLFLYILTAFSYLPFSFWGAALPILIFDAFSAVLVYLIGLQFLSEKKSFLVSLLFALAPINLFYNDYLWLNPPLVTFFALLTTYFLSEKRYEWAAIALGVSFGFKQTGLLLLPASFVLVHKKIGSKKALKFVALFAITVFVVSLPYLLTVPQHYLWCLRIPLVPKPSLAEEYYRRIFPMISVNATSPVLTYPVAGNAPINSAFPLFVLTSQGLEGEKLFTHFNNFMGPTRLGLDLVLFCSFGLLIWKIFRAKNISDRELVKYLLLSLIIFHSFYENGIFKYYLAMITPFLALYMTNRIRGMLFVSFNFSVLLIPRFLSPWIFFPFILYTATKPYLTRFTFRFGKRANSLGTTTNQQ